MKSLFPAFERHTLANGLTVLLMPFSGLPLVVFRLVTRSGATCDPDGKEGLARLTAELLHKGTRRRTTYQFSEAVEFYGGEIESVADLDNSLACGEFLARDCQRGLELFAEFLREPRLDDADILQERERIQAEVQGQLDNPSYLAGMHYARVLFAPHVYGRPVSGSLESLERITGDDVRAYYRRHYIPNDMVLSVVGEFHPTRLLSRIEKLFGDWPAGDTEKPHRQPARRIQGRRVLVIDKPDQTQAQIRFGNLGVHRTHPDYYRIHVANTLLGGGFTSRLVQAIRVDRGLSYSVHSRFRTLLDPGDFTVVTATKNESAHEIIQVALDEIKRMRSELVSEEELDGMKRYLIGLYPMGLEGIDSLAKLLTDMEFYGLEPDFPDRYPEKIAGISREDVLRVSREYFPHDDLAIVAVGNAAEIRTGLSALGPVEVRAFDESLPLAAGRERA